MTVQVSIATIQVMTGTLRISDRLGKECVDLVRGSDLAHFRLSTQSHLSFVKFSNVVPVSLEFVLTLKQHIVVRTTKPKSFIAI